MRRAYAFAVHLIAGWTGEWRSMASTLRHRMGVVASAALISTVSIGSLGTAVASAGVAPLQKADNRSDDQATTDSVAPRCSPSPRTRIAP